MGCQPPPEFRVAKAVLMVVQHTASNVCAGLGAWKPTTKSSLTKCSTLWDVTIQLKERLGQVRLPPALVQGAPPNPIGLSATV